MALTENVSFKFFSFFSSFFPFILSLFIEILLFIQVDFIQRSVYCILVKMFNVNTVNFYIFIVPFCCLLVKT